MRNMRTLRILYKHETYRLIRHSRLVLFLYPLLILLGSIIFLTLFAYPLTPLASPLALFDLMSLLQFFLLPYVGVLGFAQERNLHTHWTLLAWPIESYQFVYAKYWAWMRLTSAAIFLCVFWLFAGYTWYSYDAGLIFSGIIQILLTASLTLSLVLYFSTHLRKTWHAIFATQGCLMAWLFCDFLVRKWQATGLIAWMFQPFSYGHYADLLDKGLLTSSTWTFFIGISMFFLRRTWKAIEVYRGQEQVHARFLLPVIWVLTLFFPIEFDVSVQGLWRLHKASRVILDQVENPLYITYYFPAEHRFNQDILSVQNKLKLYDLENSWVIVRHTALDSEKEAKELGLYNQNGLYAGVLIEYLDKGALIPLLLDPDEVEYRITSKLYQIFHGRPRLIIRTGPKQPLQDYSLFTRALDMHFDVQPWVDGPMPQGDAALVLSAAGLDSDAASQVFQAHREGMGLFIGYSGIGIPSDAESPPVRYSNLAATSYMNQQGIRTATDLVLDPEGFYFSGQNTQGRAVHQAYAAWPKGFGSKNLLWRMVLPIFSVPLWPDNTWTPLLFSSPAVGLQEGPVNIDPQSLEVYKLPEASGPYILIAKKESEVPLVVAGSETLFSNLAPTLQNFIAGELLAWRLVGQSNIADIKLSHIERLLMKRPYSPILDTGRFLLQVVVFILINLMFIIFAVMRHVWYTKIAFP